MTVPVVVSWLLTGVLLLLALPCLRRLTRPGHGPLRHEDLAELLLVLAMAAMFSPVGGPIPAAGWQAAFLLLAGRFGWVWAHRRLTTDPRPAGECGHLALSAVAMLYMVTAMPHGTDSTHGPWLTMAEPVGPVAWPAVAVAVVGYFTLDAVWSGTRAVRHHRSRPPDGGRDGTARDALARDATARAVSRGVMGLAMGYMLVTAL
ncbi:protein of unknown function [Amycolatopsis arida]|uniref:DUF5134 domain-containing protein n=1 Tax=Amycolatopsis arida TaxID=587909 RepID=A0A1I5VMS7_9PSEU|nr:DUF5134 domain-containing protein [Amycolatopsis arida]TDX87955.1 uncharacterized protein DUF5134 [Amycolatopsis arida]SFQ08731.1 protein of unknown function [Amycolatopsis arida]